MGHKGALWLYCLLRGWMGDESDLQEGVRGEQDMGLHPYVSWEHQMLVPLRSKTMLK